jgi:hypothetical protein
MIYKKIDVPNLEVMISEIMTMVSPQISQNLRYWDLPLTDFYKATPTFFKYITSNTFRSIPRLFRFYNTPPYGMLGPHIDNLATAPNKIGFNIPLSGTKNTFMNYYTTPDDNLGITLSGGFGSMPAQIIKDKSKLVLIDSIEIDKPTVLRTDLIHEVVNPNNSYRLVLGMKYIGKQIEDVLIQ